MGSFRELDAQPGGTYQRMDAAAKPKPADPRQTQDYVTEKAKAKAINKVRGPQAGPGWFNAATEAAGEPLPIMDELGGALAAGGNALVNLGRRATGRPTVDSRAIYLANKDAENEYRDDRNKRHPIASGVGGLLGGLASSPAKAVGAPAMAKGLMSAGEKALAFLKGSGKAAAGGGLFASLYGLADGDGGERVDNARDNFIPGAVGGMALHGLGSAAAPLLKKVPGIAQDVVRAVTTRPPAHGVRPQASPRQSEIAALAVERLAARQGLTPEAVRELASSTYHGKPVTAAELLGREGQGQLAATARRGGATGDELEAQLRLRQQGAPGRIMDDFEHDLGVSPAAARGDVEAIVEQGRHEAAPIYDRVLADDSAVWTPELADLANRPVVRGAIGAAKNSAANAGRDPTSMGFHIEDNLERTPTVKTVQERIPGGGVRDVHMSDPGSETTRQRMVGLESPTARTWDMVKKMVDAQVERDPLTRRPITTGEAGVRNRDLATAAADLRRSLAGDETTPGAIPGYGEALNKAGDYLQVQSAFDRAKGTLTRGSVADFTRLWASAKTEAEQRAMRSALASDVMELANAGHLRGGKFGVPGIQQKLEWAFGKEGASRFIGKMEAEAQLARSGGRMMPGNGSPTFELGEAANGLDGVEDVGRILGKAGRGNLIGAAGDAVATGLRRSLAWARTTGMPVEVRDEYGRLLRMTADELEDFLAKRQPQPVQQSPGRWLLPAQAGGAVGQSSQ